MKKKNCSEGWPGEIKSCVYLFHYLRLKKKKKKKISIHLFFSFVHSSSLSVSRREYYGEPKSSGRLWYPDSDGEECGGSLMKALYVTGVVMTHRAISGGPIKLWKGRTMLVPVSAPDLQKSQIIIINKYLYSA